MSNDRVLLLNRGESVVDVIDWQTAVCLLVKGSATIPYGYDHHYKIPISTNTAARMAEEGNFETAIENDENGIERGYFILPTALVLVEYAHIPYKTAAVNLKNVLRRDKNVCGYCYKRLSASNGTIDHIIPKCRWEEFKRLGKTKGKHVNNWKNVVAACKPCNNKKDNKTPEEASMKMHVKPFVPSRDYLFLRGIDTETYEVWDRWICFDDLK